MQKLLAIILKDVALRFSSPAEWLFFLILPVIFTVILAGGTGDNGDDRVSLLVADHGRSPLSAQLIDAVDASGTVRTQVLPEPEAVDEFENRNAAALLVIPSGLTAEAVQQGSVNLEMRLLPNNTAALAAQQTVNTAVRQVSGALRIAASSVTEAERIRPFASEAERSRYYTTALQAAQAEWNAAPERVNVVQAATPDQIDYDPRINSSAGQLITWVFIPLLGIAGSFVYERQIGTLRRLLVTPTRKGFYLFATILGQVILALVQMALLLLFGTFVMKINWGSAPGALMALMAASALAAAGIGTAFGAFIKTPGQANGVAIMAGMLMALLGGCWYPIELFPVVIQNITRVFPTRWAMEGVLNIALRGGGLSSVLPHIGILLGFALLFFAVGAARFRYE